MAIEEKKDYRNHSKVIWESHILHQCCSKISKLKTPIQPWLATTRFRRCLQWLLIKIWRSLTWHQIFGSKTKSCYKAPKWTSQTCSISCSCRWQSGFFRRPRNQRGLKRAKEIPPSHAAWRIKKWGKDTSQISFDDLWLEFSSNPLR